MEVLEFFTNPWHFADLIIVIVAVGSAVEDIVKANRK